MELAELPELLVQEVRLVRLEHQVLQVSLEQMVCQEQAAYLELMELVELQEHQVQVVHQEQVEAQELRE
jgi:hypothetical protein